MTAALLCRSLLIRIKKNLIQKIQTIPSKEMYDIIEKCGGSVTCTKVVHVYTVQVITIQNIVQTFVNACDPH